MMLNTALEYQTAYLLLGGNLGDREDNLRKAIALIAENIGSVVSISALYETAAWGKTDQPSFLNQAVAVETNFPAIEVLNKALEIEKVLGRVRKDKWGERLIDIDLILYGNEVIDIENKLQVPHPHMQERRFVMAPLAEIAPGIVHPILGKTILDIFENITDKLDAKKL
ncbi:MAG: 2-amino-4-hydroxy-6-hydroxymethyldihydropteridine diphosphokinase [Pedobacter sp.]|nr:MAG: 2-amino-4-hydroxy-6-hydroxymethyldihydropteridine diphosphokinase [Pedobacter sp.]